jgi:hypothetical protein
MTTVKGTKERRLKVVSYNPYIQPLLVLGVVLVCVLIGVASFWAGNSRGMSLQEQAMVERDELRLKLQTKMEETEILSQQVANLSLASEVDKASSEDVRGEVIALKEEIAALSEEISLYRGLMAPTENRQGLTIGSLELIPTGVPRQYDFKVVVQQLATNHQILIGHLNFTVVGKEGEFVRSIPLKDLTSQIDEEDIRLRFKYFQNIQGQLELPLGFEPERIELMARSTGRDGVAVEKKFGWLVQES